MSANLTTVETPTDQPSDDIRLEQMDGNVYAIARSGIHEAKMRVPAHFFHLSPERQDFHANAICVELKKQLAQKIHRERLTIKAIKDA